MVWTESNNLPRHPNIVSYIQRSIRVHGDVDGFTQLEQSKVWEGMVSLLKRSARQVQWLPKACT